MTVVKIPDTHYVRDIHSKALLNTDKKSLNKYLMEKEIAKKQSEKAQQIDNRLSSLELQLSVIQELLIKLTTRLDNAN